MIVRSRSTSCCAAWLLSRSAVSSVCASSAIRVRCAWVRASFSRDFSVPIRTRAYSSSVSSAALISASCALRASSSCARVRVSTFLNLASSCHACTICASSRRSSLRRNDPMSIVRTRRMSFWSIRYLLAAVIQRHSTGTPWAIKGQSMGTQRALHGQHVQVPRAEGQLPVGAAVVLPSLDGQGAQPLPPSHELTQRVESR